MANEKGIQRLDMNGQSYGIEVRFPAGSATEATANHWVRAQTLLAQKVDSFDDESEVSSRCLRRCRSLPTFRLGLGPRQISERMRADT
eukprot:6019441-Prymnesium_polylepis.1